MSTSELYKEVRFYNPKKWAIKLSKGKDEVIEWQWMLIRPFIYVVIGLLGILHIIDGIMATPVVWFFLLCEKFENTITHSNPKGNRWLVPPMFLSLALSGPTIIWGSPMIAIRHWRNGKERKRVSRDVGLNHSRHCVCTNCYEHNMNQYGHLDGTIPDREYPYERRRGHRYMMINKYDMVNGRVKKHKL